jgi:phosphoribosylpyrophosphate synthetase
MLVIIAKTEEQDSLIVTNKVIASKGKLGVFLSEYWDASPTIAECIARFLECESIEEVKERIEAGRYKIIPELTIL